MFTVHRYVMDASPPLGSEVDTNVRISDDRPLIGVRGLEAKKFGRNHLVVSHNKVVADRDAASPTPNQS